MSKEQTAHNSFETHGLAFPRLPQNVIDVAPLGPNSFRRLGEHMRGCAVQVSHG
jgi:hypothetical protein